MSLILYLFLGIFLWWIYKLIVGVMRARNQFRQFFNQAGGVDQHSRQTSTGGRKGGWSAPLRRRKKIGQDVGEYVRFTETDVTKTETETNRTEAGSYRVTREEQVTDVEWEDLPR